MFSYGCHSIRTHHEQVETPNPEIITRIEGILLRIATHFLSRVDWSMR